MAKFPISQRKACELMQIERSSCRYPAKPERQPEIREEVKRMAELHPRYGYRRVTALLNREGRQVNHKRIARLRRQMGLILRRRPRRRLKREQPLPLSATAANQQWAMDFVSDAAANGQTIRVLTVIDVFTRECLALEVAASIGSQRVIRVLERVLATGRPAPASIRVDNGPEFIAGRLKKWSEQKHIAIRYIQPGKPVQNGHIESFNGKLRDECLNMHWFLHLGHARQVIEQWRTHYNGARPHSSLNYRSPAEFAASLWEGVPLPPGTPSQSTRAA